MLSVIYGECHILALMLSVIKPSVKMSSVIMLSVKMLSVVMLSVAYAEGGSFSVIPNVIRLNVTWVESHFAAS
jgi:hypothetical protein